MWCYPRSASCRLDFFPDIDCPVLLLDTPARDWVQRRRAQRLSGTQAETGVVPGTADSVLDEDPLGERTVVVSAFGADREQLLTATRQQHCESAPNRDPAVF